MPDIYHEYHRTPTVAARMNVDWRHNEWEFVVSGADQAGNKADIPMDRPEALRLRRHLNALLRATAPRRR